MIMLVFSLSPLLHTASSPSRAHFLLVFVSPFSPSLPYSASLYNDLREVAAEHARWRNLFFHFLCCLCCYSFALSLSFLHFLPGDLASLYNDLREAAAEHARWRNFFFREATRAFNMGDGRTAKLLSAKVG